MTQGDKESTLEQVMGLATKLAMAIPKARLTVPELQEHFGSPVLGRLVEQGLGARPNAIDIDLVRRAIPPRIVQPDIKLSGDEEIRRRYPAGFFMIVQAGIDLFLLHRIAHLFGAGFNYHKDPWVFEEGYGVWAADGSGCRVQRILTTECEIFFPDPREWLIPGSKGGNRDDCLEMQLQFGRKNLPPGWKCRELSVETLVLAAFERHRQTGEYPLRLDNARCTNRYGSAFWLKGGVFASTGFNVRDWSKDGGNTHLGALRCAVRSRRNRSA
ncbi:MAG: hypothetical protein A2Y57_02450 [Candidatus Woykebacteria bacterium RBG_13_40_7b]|uniref:Uncharacterized protein n=1 Tax=Candidatus Woykebacteria bacterium RBG_13_40_7b TaxID=1802594 RepID=A0A1G1WBW7_9BACT|nr:MAG: hypothetical protein A2Y57_02450 [Candidatus Woykebacteria bacterium RBG_13_40_7b]